MQYVCKTLLKYDEFEMSGDILDKCSVREKTSKIPKFWALMPL